MIAVTTITIRGDQGGDVESAELLLTVALLFSMIFKASGGVSL